MTANISTHIPINCSFRFLKKSVNYEKYPDKFASFFATDFLWILNPYSGLIFKSCELMFKTSEQASKFEESSLITNEKNCELIADKMGKKFIVKYQNSLFNYFIETDYLIKNLENIN